MVFLLIYGIVLKQVLILKSDKFYIYHQDYGNANSTLVISGTYNSSSLCGLFTPAYGLFGARDYRGSKIYALITTIS